MVCPTGIMMDYEEYPLCLQDTHTEKIATNYSPSLQWADDDVEEGRLNHSFTRRKKALNCRSNSETFRITFWNTGKYEASLLLLSCFAAVLKDLFPVLPSCQYFFWTLLRPSIVFLSFPPLSISKCIPATGYIQRWTSSSSNKAPSLHPTHRQKQPEPFIQQGKVKDVAKHSSTFFRV